MLLSEGGLGTVGIMRRTGKSKTCVWRWQERFAEDGVDSLIPRARVAWAGSSGRRRKLDGRRVERQFKRLTSLGHNLIDHL